jgi:hypothetical protein
MGKAPAVLLATARAYTGADGGAVFATNGIPCVN